MQKIFIGSNNYSKISDWKFYLGEKYKIFTPKDLKIKLYVQESDLSLVGNATKKAKDWAKASGMVTISDDAGFFIKELRDAPGVITKRWLEVNNYTDDKVLNFVRKLKNKQCIYKSAIAVASPVGLVYSFLHQVKGKLVAKHTNGNKFDNEYSLGKYFRQLGNKKYWSEMSCQERKRIDSEVVNKTELLIRKILVYERIIEDIAKKPQKITLGFPTSKPDQLALDVFTYALPLQPNNCGLHTNKKGHKNPFKIHEVKSITSLGGFLGDQNVDGYLNSGATESNIVSLWIAREMFKKAHYDSSKIVLFKTKLTHYSIVKATGILGLTNNVDIALNKKYAMSLTSLKTRLTKSLKQKKCVIIVATAGYNIVGTTDDIKGINSFIESLDDNLKEKIFLHIDTATLGFISPFLDNKCKFFKYRNVRSIALDGHKTGLIPYPCGIFLIRKGLVNNIKSYVEYLGTDDQTLSGSRPGASASALWAMLEGIGFDGYKDKAKICIDNKNYLIKKLKKIFPKITIIDSPTSNIPGIHFG